jgi:uncharacterized DUF497 family protein
MKGELPDGCAAFDWDEGNLEKNWIKHRVSPFECEQIFFNQPLVVAGDEKHSQKEARYYALGRTDADRYLFVVFTLRGNLIRIISARDMNKKEKKIYGA